jgi:hypothetical protein
VDTKNKCLICNSDLRHPTQTDVNMLVLYDCPRCGEFIVDVHTQIMFSAEITSDPEKIAVVSHAVRKRHRPILTIDVLKNLLQETLPNPAEQADNLILWLGNNSKGAGEHVEVRGLTHQSIFGTKSENGFYFIINHLIDDKVIEGRKEGSLYNNAFLRLTFAGWKHYEELKKGTIHNRKAFMAMKFGDPKLDKIVEEVFKNAVQKAGFELFRLNDNPKAGLIDDRMRVEIRTSRFLIADLTHDNAGAYWEAGYAEGLNKPVIYTCEKSKFDENKTHFDTNHHLTIAWDADKPDEAGDELKATIRATMPEDAILTDE